MRFKLSARHTSCVSAECVAAAVTLALFVGITSGFRGARDGIGACLRMRW